MFPKSEWDSIAHIFITHGDPDHYWHADRAADEWKAISEPDVLMIPIGGKTAHNTMDEDEALEAVRIMIPARVIPCHYNCPGFFTKTYNPDDDAYFKREVKKLGAECIILRNADSLRTIVTSFTVAAVRYVYIG